MIIRSEKFNFEDLPRFFCPNCKKGQLRIIKDSVIMKHPAWILKLPETPDETFDQDGRGRRSLSKISIIGNEGEQHIVTFFLKCDRETCNEVVATSGDIKCKYQREYDGEFGDIFIDYYYPKSFTPTIDLFVVPIKTPQSVSNELRTAFSLFWINPPSCANSLRKTVERFMDNLELQKTSNQKLHSRINNLDNKYNDFKELLLATKWIGNDGSHESDLNHQDVILGFEFIEKCLEQIYGVEERDLNEIAKKINQKKKPLSKN